MEKLKIKNVCGDIVVNSLNFLKNISDSNFDFRVTQNNFNTSIETNLTSANYYDLYNDKNSKAKIEIRQDKIYAFGIEQDDIIFSSRKSEEFLGIIAKNLVFRKIITIDELAKINGLYLEAINDLTINEINKGISDGFSILKNKNEMALKREELNHRRFTASLEAARPIIHGLNALKHTTDSKFNFWVGDQLFRVFISTNVPKTKQSYENDNAYIIIQDDKSIFATGFSEENIHDATYEKENINGSTDEPEVFLKKIAAALVMKKMILPLNLKPELFEDLEDHSPQSP